MTVYKDCYETTVGSMLDTKKIVTSIKESMIKDSLGHVSLNFHNVGNYKPVFVTGSAPSESEIPLFTHPIKILNFHNTNYVCSDLRFFLRKDTPIDQIEESVKNRTEMNFVKSRTMLSVIWLAEGTSKMKNSLQFAGVVYAAWLAESISKTYNLDFKDQTVLAILSSLFYQSVFSDENVFTEEDKQKMAVHTIKATKAPSALVFEVFDKVKKLDNIEDYCQAVSDVTENIRLKNFNLAILLTIVKNSWYGLNAKEIISVALEHPPTWAAVVYTSLSERTYKTSLIYRIAERFGKRGASDEFLKNYVNLIQEFTVTDKQPTVVYPTFD